MPPEITPDYNHSKSLSFKGLWLYVVLFVVIATSIFLVVEKRKSFEVETNKVICIKQQPEKIDGKDITFGLVEITVDPAWTMLSGSHPTVTFHGYAESVNEKIKYAQFAYHTQQHPEMYIVDATKRKGNHFHVKIRDLKPEDTGICYFIIVTNKSKYASKPLSFKIPQKTSE